MQHHDEPLLQVHGKVRCINAINTGVAIALDAQMSAQALPVDLFHLLAEELAERLDFATLFNCVASSARIANSGAIAALYRYEALTRSLQKEIQCSLTRIQYLALRPSQRWWW